HLARNIDKPPASLSSRSKNPSRSVYCSRWCPPPLGHLRLSAGHTAHTKCRRSIELGRGDELAYLHVLVRHARRKLSRSNKDAVLHSRRLHVPRVGRHEHVRLDRAHRGLPSQHVTVRL